MDLIIKPEVKAALDAGLPVVALESTIISHGMPYPENVETALETERIIREEGAVPATIAILGGKIHVGLTEAELELLASRTDVFKVSRRDMPYVLSQGKYGATTVAATMIIAHMAGISVFVTGGIGGVHRGYIHTLDVSADLQELSQTPVAVVCAGVKSILDIGFTLEYLETMGVEVVGYQTEEMPAFYTQSSGFSVDFRMDSPEEVAALLAAKKRLSFKGGTVIANPIPEEHQMPREEIEAAISQALAEADERKITGKKITPYLLDRVKELTEGESLEANRELVYNNARVGSRIAVALSKLI